MNWAAMTDLPPFTGRAYRTYLENIKRQMEWAEYEVDPAWKNFVQFGPNDIGGPFEQLGIIRKRPKVDVVYVSPDLYQALRKSTNQMWYGQRPEYMGQPTILCGAKIEVNYALTGMQAFGLNQSAMEYLKGCGGVS